MPLPQRRRILGLSAAAVTVPMEQVHQRTRQQKEACASPVNATRVALRWIDELMHLKRQSGSDGVIVAVHQARRIAGPPPGCGGEAAAAATRGISDPELARQCILCKITS